MTRKKQSLVSVQLEVVPSNNPNANCTIQYMVDDNEQKHNKYSPGDHILVRPTNYIYENKPDYLLILAWVHSKNIIKNNQKYLENGGSFIVCFPELKIISKKYS